MCLQLLWIILPCLGFIFNHFYKKRAFGFFMVWFVVFLCEFCVHRCSLFIVSPIPSNLLFQTSGVLYGIKILIWWIRSDYLPHGAAVMFYSCATELLYLTNVLLFSFPSFVPLKLTFMVWCFAVYCMQPPFISLWWFFSHCHCITVSLPFLFHFALFFPPVPFFHNYPHLSLSSSPNSHNFTPRKNTKSQHLHLARSLHIQQVLQPVDPSAIPGLRAHLESEGDKDDGQLASASQLSQPSELTQPSSAGNPPGGLYAWEGRGSRHVQDQGVSFCKCGCCCFVCVCHRWTPACCFELPLICTFV